MLWSLVLIVLVGFTGSEASNCHENSSTACCKVHDEIKGEWKTSQSSDWIDENVTYDSERAVDPYADTCSHTNQTSGNWWRIDLLSVYTISCVCIFNIENHASNLTGAQIYIGNSREENGTANPTCRNITNFTIKKCNDFRFNPGVSGRYVTVFLPRNDFLILCDVKIFGKKKESPFQLIMEKKTWADALDYCRGHHETLASIVDEETQTWAELEADNSSTPFVWVGLRYTCTLGFWFWVEDLIVEFTRWAPGSKIEECNMSGAIEKQGNHSWSTKCADMEFEFICKK
uniref:C-type lectin domain-containing protein n=2 Tax=Gasterosteus aculeatus TaxID=69293 RepID=A0AAQ4RH95_GASAC|nr:macrophage mannose receptor 1-like [Gasterosteus aculeatus aculeatus]XP_040021370.1 macrophage mannose receptor 1-like [Gasterosteus aculeatus aculeatus]